MNAREEKSSGKDTDSLTREWRQGDFTKELPVFFYIGTTPSTENETSLDLYEEEEGIVGLVALSQTCDLVRSAEARPYIQVCPVIELPDEAYSRVQKGKSSQFAAIPGARAERLVADLDRVMTVTKSVVAGWKRENGCLSDEDRVAFAQALERKWGRFAFPDDFSEGIRKFVDHIFGKHGRASSPAGLAYRALDEIRVRGAPDWNANEVEVTFYFIISPGVDRVRLPPHLDTLIEKIDFQTRCALSEPSYYIVTLDDLSAREYVESVSLDFEVLSFR